MEETTIQSAVEASPLEASVAPVSEAPAIVAPVSEAPTNLAPVSEASLAPVSEAPVSEAPASLAPVSVAPISNPVSLPVDIVFNKMILNSSLLATIHTLKTNGFNNASIPTLILSAMSTYNSYIVATPAHALTADDIQVLLERVYNYLVDKYNLIDVADRLAMYNLFDVSLKLCLAIPIVKKEVASCLNFFRCVR